MMIFVDNVLRSDKAAFKDDGNINLHNMPLPISEKFETEHTVYN